MAEETIHGDQTNGTPETQPVEKGGAQEPKKGASALLSTIEKLEGGIDSLSERFDTVEKRLEKAEQPQYPFGMPGQGVHGVRTGEDPLSSRPWSLSRLAIGLTKRQNQDPGWNNHCKIELDLSKRLRDAYTRGMGYQETPGRELMPLSADLMPTEEVEKDDGTKLPGVPKELVKECRDVMKNSMSGFDYDEYQWMQKRGVLPRHPLQKDLSANTATSGGTLVGLASEGELIELLRAMEVMSRAGAQEISLPPQGRIRFPRQTSGVTIAAYAEAATITESTPNTSSLTLDAKAYSGLVDIPEELMKFATSVSVESWLRGEFTRDLALQVDSDMIEGAGGTSIQGIINYSGVTSVTASTTGANGDTLDPEDPLLLYANIADADAPVDRGFFYALTNILWASLSTRKASSSGEFMFNVAANQLGGGMMTQTLNGHQVVPSTQIPTDRSKGASNDLTILLGGVGNEWLIGRAGVVEIDMTNSDASKFQTRLSTMRGTQYVDAGPRHEESFGFIDTLTNS